MSGKPTPQQIETVTKLKALGLCQEVEKWIIYDWGGDELKITDSQSKIAIAKKRNKAIGPFPTAEGCRQEIKELLDKHDCRISILSHYACCHKNEDEEDVIFETDEYIEDLDEFYRQTLISLAEIEK